MTDIKISFKTDYSKISLDALIDSLSSVRSGIKSVVGNKVAFTFNYMKELV